MRLISSDSPIDAYGRWNALVAFDRNDEPLGIIRAHDGDFFPESVLDYAEILRSNKEYSSSNVIHHPIRVDIDITQVCNSSCSFCFSRPYQKKGYRSQFASFNTLRDVIQSLGKNGTKSIRFCGGGDPMLHPDIERILPLTHDENMKLCVISNLDFIDSAKSELILDCVDHLRWSVNAATDSTRTAIHRPIGKANPLHVSMDTVKALARKRRKRRPIIWATYLILPENFREIVSAASKLRHVGVDSISFRPVFHGLGGGWTKEELSELNVILDEVSQYDDRPNFLISVPKRELHDAATLDPRQYFSNCLSRQYRTVLEATSDGLTCQSCGIYRGTGSVGRASVNETRTFQQVWQEVQSGKAHPQTAPQMCNQCIDVSMNVTLEAIAAVLRTDRQARFYRAQLNADELQDVGPKALLVGDSEPPTWVIDKRVVADIGDFESQANR